MKYRVKFTCEDWYDYLNTNTYASLRKRAIDSMPSQIRYGKFYNFKFKRVCSPFYHRYHKFYRVSVSVDMLKEDIEYMISECESFMHDYSNFSYKPIKRVCSGKCT